MPRTRTLPDEVVLERAAAIFWQQGYAGTSLRDLQQATGLSSAALYNRFSDKDGLFIEVLRQYADKGLRERIQRLSAYSDPLVAIYAFYDELLKLSLTDPDHKGCLLINTALDGAAIAPEVRAFVQGCMNELEAFFLTLLNRACTQGLLASCSDLTNTATALVGTVLGLRVLARLDPDSIRLQALVKHNLACFLPPPELTAHD